MSTPALSSGPQRAAQPVADQCQRCHLRGAGKPAELEDHLPVVGPMLFAHFQSPSVERADLSLVSQINWLVLRDMRLAAALEQHVVGGRDDVGESDVVLESISRSYR
jgi:hypothetical protein